VTWAPLGVVLFSFSVPLTKLAVEGFDPFLTATGRAAIAGALAVVLVGWRRVPRPPRDQLRPLLVTMLGAVFGWPILLALALQRTTSAHAAVIAAFMPLTTALIAVLRTHERVSWQFWVAAARAPPRCSRSRSRAAAPRAATSLRTGSSPAPSSRRLGATSRALR